MTNISGGPKPAPFEANNVLEAVKLNEATRNWVATEVPDDSEGNVGDVVFIPGGPGGSPNPTWQDWTIDWLGTFVPGGSIITSRYTVVGKVAYAFADVTLQSGWSIPQPLKVAPPVPPASNAAARAVVGNVNLMLNAVGYPAEGSFHRTNCTVDRMWIGRLAVNGSNLQITDIEQTQPGAWADGDNFRFSMAYEVA